MAFGTATIVTNAGLAIATNLLAGSGTVPKYLGVGTGANTAARTAAAIDTALSSETGSRVGTNNPTRTTTNTTNDTWNISQTFTAASGAAIDEAGIFDASTSGNMFISATFGVMTLGIGDTLQLNYSVVLDQ